MAFAEKYRPQRFDDLFGQPQAIAALKDSFGSDVHRSLLLVGPSGTGKTTAARLYAKQMICTQAPNMGCGQCDDCLRIMNGQLCFGYQEIDCGRFPERATGRHVSEMLASSPMCNWVMFADEAQALDRDAANALLKAVELPSSTTRFIGATTDEHLVLPALRKRCRTIYFKPLSAAQSYSLLSNVCVKEGINFEPKALDMIGARAQGSAREGLILLENVAQQGPVTVALVADTLAVGSTAHVLAYLEAVARGDTGVQEAALYEWQAAPLDKARMIRDCLLYLYGHEVAASRLDDIVNPAFFQVTAAERQRVVGVFRARAYGRSFADYWLDLLDMWEINPLTLTDDPSLKIKAYRFHRAVNPDNVIAATLASPDPASSAVPEKPARLPRSRSAQRLPGRSRRRGAEASAFLDQVQAERIYDMATFLPQQHGLLFNSLVSLHHGRLGGRNEDDAGQLVSTLTHELRLGVERWSPGEAAHWIYAHRRDGEDILTDIVMHIPADALPHLESFLARRLANLRGETANEEGAWALDAASPDRASGWDRNRFQRHWHLVRHLWRGIDPDRVDWDEKDRRVPLLDLLKVPMALRAPVGMLTKLRAIGSSRSLGPAERKVAAMNRMAFLSAFADDAWGAVASGWELDEYRDRLAEAARRADDEARITAEFPSSANRLERQAAETAAAQLQESWPLDPRHRRRGWKGWWTRSR